MELITKTQTEQPNSSSPAAVHSARRSIRTPEHSTLSPSSSSSPPTPNAPGYSPSSTPTASRSAFDLGLGCPELGYVSLIELRTVRGNLGLPIERDLHFEANKPISDYADEARVRGRIVA
jgi:hypothetical protein